MENAHVLLGVRDSASLGDIEEAYRNKKQLYNPDSFRKGTPEWEFAYARSQALDRAYSEAVSVLLAPRRSDFALGRIRTFSDRSSRESGKHVPGFGELATLLSVSPIAACLMQLLVPSILFDLTPGGLRAGSLVPVAFVVALGYALPLVLRFAILKRPLESLSVALALFPATLFTADLFASALLYFSFLLPGHEFRYIPAFYVTGWGPLFLILCAHCAILRVSIGGRGQYVPALRRLASHTCILFLSVGLSLFACAAGNREKTGAVLPVEGAPAELWQNLELFDAGVMEIPASWYVEDSNGQDRRIEHGQVVQHVRVVLLARPCGQREKGPNFAFEVIVYRWTHRNGQRLSPPAGALPRLQDRQFESLQRNYPDITDSIRAQSSHEGYTVDAMTVETRAVPGYVIRFKNLAFERNDRLYCLMVGYPAEEEHEWESRLNDILRRWKP